jgi:hypothetical protein
MAGTHGNGKSSGGSSAAHTSGGKIGSGALLKFRNRSLSTYRGTSFNEFGDASDVGAAYLTGIPAAIAETTDVVFDAATQRPQIIRTITCVVPNWADIDDSDTLYDPASGFFYEVERIEARPGPGYYPPDKLLGLRMRSGITIASDLGGGHAGRIHECGNARMAPRRNRRTVPDRPRPPDLDLGPRLLPCVRRPEQHGNRRVAGYRRPRL